MYEMPIDLLQRFAKKYGAKEPERYFFPWALGLIDKLHQLYGALEKCCKRSKLYKNFIDILIILQTFYCDKGLLRKFKATCFEGYEQLVSMFDNIPTVHIDWRWESLCKALDQNIPLFPVLKARFRKDKLEARDGSGMLSNSTVKSLDKTLKRKLTSLQSQRWSECTARSPRSTLACSRFAIAIQRFGVVA